MRPTVGRTVLYFPNDERQDIGRQEGRVWPAIVTFVHERGYDANGQEIGPWVISLTAFPPLGDKQIQNLGAVTYAAVPLTGMYDREDLDKHPEWVGCWNWPPRIVE